MRTSQRFLEGNTILKDTSSRGYDLPTPAHYVELEPNHLRARIAYRAYATKKHRTYYILPSDLIHVDRAYMAFCVEYLKSLSSLAHPADRRGGWLDDYVAVAQRASHRSSRMDAGASSCVYCSEGNESVGLLLFLAQRPLRNGCLHPSSTPFIMR